MSEESKFCPFCGGEAKEIDPPREGYWMGFWRVRCTVCGATMNGSNRHMNLCAWNRRAERTCRLEWRDNGDGYPPSVRCSACGGWLDAVADVEDVALFEFCPMCGARIKEGEA